MMKILINARIPTVTLVTLLATVAEQPAHPPLTFIPTLVMNIATFALHFVQYQAIPTTTLVMRAVTSVVIPAHLLLTNMTTIATLLVMFVEPLAP